MYTKNYDHMHSVQQGLIPPYKNIPSPFSDPPHLQNL